MPGDENSVFTKHLLAGLTGGVPSDDGAVRVFDLFEFDRVVGGLFKSRAPVPSPR